jgi:hypothetical protein
VHETKQESRCKRGEFDWKSASPASVRRFAAGLLDQQMWCWGRDIRRGERNVLMEYGFTRWRPPPGTLGSTAYQLDSPPRRQVVLWGFGLFFGDGIDGGIFLKRYAFAPLWSRHSDLRAALWRPEDLPEFGVPRTAEERSSVRGLLSALLHRTADYESWVLATLGPEYRRQCVSSWSKAVAEAETVPDHWRRLAESCVTILAPKPVPAGS